MASANPPDYLFQKITNWDEILEDPFTTLNKALIIGLKKQICLFYVEKHLPNRNGKISVPVEEHLKTVTTSQVRNRCKDLIHPAINKLIFDRIGLNSTQKNAPEDQEVFNELGPVFWADYLDEYYRRINILIAGFSEERKSQIKSFAKINQNFLGYRALIALQNWVNHAERVVSKNIVYFNRIAWMILLDQLAVALYLASLESQENEWMGVILESVVNIRCRQDKDWNVDNKLYEALKDLWGNDFEKLDDLSLPERPLKSVQDLVKTNPLTVYMGHYLKSQKIFQRFRRNKKTDNTWTKKISKGEIPYSGRMRAKTSDDFNDESSDQDQNQNYFTHIIVSELYEIRPENRIKLIVTHYLTDVEDDLCPYLTYLANTNPSFLAFCNSFVSLKLLDEGIYYRGLTNFEDRRKKDLGNFFVADEMDIKNHRVQISKIYRKEFRATVKERILQHIIDAERSR